MCLLIKNNVVKDCVVLSWIVGLNFKEWNENGHIGKFGQLSVAILWPTGECVKFVWTPF